MHVCVCACVPDAPSNDAVQNLHLIRAGEAGQVGS